MTDADDPFLTSAESAERLGIRASTWRSYTSWRTTKHGRKPPLAPPPDDPDLDSPQERRRPRWRTSTIERFQVGRLGQGYRTDLRASARELQQRRAAEIAQPPTAPSAALQTWLQLNHPQLLAAAELFTDNRDELLRFAPENAQDGLAEALDAAGEAMSRQPSRALAAAVHYALFWLRPDGPVTLPPNSELAAMVSQFSKLRQSYDAVRNA